MKIQLFKDILKTKVEGSMKYSQGRIYLFVFIVAYLAVLLYYMFFPTAASMTTIIDSVQWAILLFAAYVFGTNGVSATKDIFKITNGKDAVAAVTNVANNVTPTDTNTAPADVANPPK